MKNKNILVVGGAGFIGSYFVDRLLEDQHHITVFDNLSSGKSIWVDNHLTNENFKFMQGDLLNKEDINKVIKNQHVVLYLGGNSDIRIGATDSYR